MRGATLGSPGDRRDPALHALLAAGGRRILRGCRPPGIVVIRRDDALDPGQLPTGRALADDARGLVPGVASRTYRLPTEARCDVSETMGRLAAARYAIGCLGGYGSSPSVWASAFAERSGTRGVRCREAALGRLPSRPASQGGSKVNRPLLVHACRLWMRIAVQTCSCWSRRCHNCDSRLVNYLTTKAGGLPDGGAGFGGD